MFPFLKIIIDIPVHFSSINSPTYILCELSLIILSLSWIFFIYSMNYRSSGWYLYCFIFTLKKNNRGFLDHSTKFTWTVKDMKYRECYLYMLQAIEFTFKGAWRVLSEVFRVWGCAEFLGFLRVTAERQQERQENLSLRALSSHCSSPASKYIYLFNKELATMIRSFTIILHFLFD